MKRFFSASLLLAMLFSSSACSGGRNMLPSSNAQTAAGNTSRGALCGSPMALQQVQAGERIAQCDSCPGDPSKICISPNPPGTPIQPPPGSPGGPGGGNGYGHCPQIVGFAGNPCFPGAPGNPGTVALIPPAPGTPCDGSQLQLGSQWPVNTTDYNDEVTNIIAIQANNLNGAPEIAGWEYVVGNNRAVYIQGNPQFKTFWTSVAESVPGLGPVVQNFDTGGIVQVNSSLASQIQNYVAGHNGKNGSCFTRGLAA